MTAVQELGLLSGPLFGDPRIGDKQGILGPAPAKFLAAPVRIGEGLFGETVHCTDPGGGVPQELLELVLRL